jgi:hypothetical protein
MTTVASEAANGFFVHGFTTERYLRETTLPAPIRSPALCDTSSPHHYRRLTLV